MLADASLLTFNGTIIVQALIFLFTAYLLYRIGWGRLMSVIESRNARIEEGVRNAAEAERRLAKVHEDVRKELDRAREQAREILDRAHKEAMADAMVNRARADIEVERDSALQEIRGQVGTLVVEAAAKVLGQAIDARAHERLIEESLSSVRG